MCSLRCYSFPLHSFYVLLALIVWMCSHKNCCWLQFLFISFVSLSFHFPQFVAKKWFCYAFGIVVANQTKTKNGNRHFKMWKWPLISRGLFFRNVWTTEIYSMECCLCVSSWPVDRRTNVYKRITNSKQFKTTFTNHSNAIEFLFL